MRYGSFKNNVTHKQFTNPTLYIYIYIYMCVFFKLTWDLCDYQKKGVSIYMGSM